MVLAEIGRSQISKQAKKRNSETRCLYRDRNDVGSQELDRRRFPRRWRLVFPSQGAPVPSGSGPFLHGGIAHTHSKNRVGGLHFFRSPPISNKSFVE